ncbi:MAG: hypothetical protein MR594_03730 [Lachnospiraceae bacterium]|nr:hypothetical protein [Lachnospiraceae bacterium]
MKDTIRKTTLRLCMFLAVCFTFLMFGNVKSVFAADASAILYKNGTKVQSYATMDEAFNAMTDSSANYSVDLKGQHVVARTSWPKVKSITIDGGRNNAQLILPEGTTTLNSNVTVKDWLTILPEPKEKRMICATIDVQNYKFTVDGTHGYKTALGFIYNYDYYYAYYLDFISNGTGTVDIKSDCQMLGTFHMPNVTQEDEMTLWTPGEADSHIVKWTQNKTVMSQTPDINFRTNGDGRITIDHAYANDIIDSWTYRFSLTTKSFAYDSNGNPGTGNLTIKNLEADGITYSTENKVMPYCDVRIEKGLADKSWQVSIMDDIYLSGINVEATKNLGVKEGDKVIYAPDADVSSLYIEARREYVHAKGYQYSSQGVQPKMAVDASGNVVIQSLPKFTLNSPKLLMTKNKSTTLKVTEKSSDVASVNWSVQGSNGNPKISVSGDVNQVTVQSLGEISESDSISYSVYDTSGNLLMNGFYMVKDKTKDEENTENGIWEIGGVDYTAVFDGSYYVNKYPDVKAAVGTDLWMAFYHFRNYGMAEGRQGKETFDVNSYRNQYADLRAAFGDDLKSYYMHYINSGRAEGRKGTGCTSLQGATTVYNGVDYSAVYDYDYYTKKYSDVKNAFGNDEAAVLAHFVNYGMAEGRQGKKTFDVNFYRNQYADLRAAFGKDLKSYYMHYMTSGKKEGRKGTGCTSLQGAVTVYNGVDYSAVYDYNYYIKKYSDIRKVFGNDDAAVLAHFVNNGMSEGRQGKDSFSVTSYRNQYADLRAAFGNDLKSYYMHYMTSAKKEGRAGTGCKTLQGAVTVYNGVDYSAVYDYNYYISNNGDLKAALGEDDVALLAHFVNYGMAEGRKASEEFNVNVYKKNYSDLRSAFGNDLKSYYIHYITSGKAEGRVAK